MKTCGRTWISLVAFVSIGVGCMTRTHVDNSSRTHRSAEAIEAGSASKSLPRGSTIGVRRLGSAPPSRRVDKPQTQRAPTATSRIPRGDGSPGSVAAAATAEESLVAPASVPLANSALRGKQTAQVGSGEPPPARAGILVAPRVEVVKFAPPPTQLQAANPTTIVRRKSGQGELTTEFVRFRRVGGQSSADDFGLSSKDTGRYAPLPTGLFPLRERRSALGEFLDKVVEGSVVGIRECP